MTLGKLLKQDGRTQVWLREQLVDEGVVRSKTQICAWCKGYNLPRDEYIVTAIARVLGKKEDTIKQCLQVENDSITF
jgi:hypothetical protein